MRTFKNLMFVAAMMAFTAGMTTGCAKKQTTVPAAPDTAADGDAEADADKGDACAAPDQPDPEDKTDDNPCGGW